MRGDICPLLYGSFQERNDRRRIRYVFIPRSNTVLITCAVMRKHGLNAIDAIDKLQSIRPIVCPNIGFREQLKVYKAAEYDIEMNPEPYLEWKSELKKSGLDF
jgi:hypothetical protein